MGLKEMKENFNEQKKTKQPQCERDTKCQYCVKIFGKVYDCVFIIKSCKNTETVFSPSYQSIQEVKLIDLIQ